MNTKKSDAIVSLEELIKKLAEKSGHTFNISDVNRKITAKEFEEMRRQEALQVIRDIKEEKQLSYDEYMNNMYSNIEKRVKFNLKSFKTDAHNREACTLGCNFATEAAQIKENSEAPLLFITGRSGTGKSVLSLMIVHEFLKVKYKLKSYPRDSKLPFCMIKNQEELKKIWYFNQQETPEEHKERERALYALKNVDLLIIEDFCSNGFGLDAFEQKNFGYLLRARSDNLLPVVITSNATPHNFRMHIGNYCFDALMRFNLICAYLTGASRRTPQNDMLNIFN